MDYLPCEEFNFKFPVSNIFVDDDCYRDEVRVYRSGKYVVKMFIHNLPEFIREVTYYTLLNHPCIIKPIAWTFDKNCALFAMPLGMDIIEAYKDKLITIEEIVSDTLSAIGYMTAKGVNHNDIKIGNILYHESKAKFIDFGLAKPYIPSEGSFEMFKAGISYYIIYTGNTTINECIFDIKHLDWLMDEIKKEVSVFDILSTAPKELLIRKYCMEGKYTEVKVRDLYEKCKSLFTGREELLIHACDIISKIVLSLKYDISDEINEAMIEIMIICQCNILDSTCLSNKINLISQNKLSSELQMTESKDDLHKELSSTGCVLSDKDIINELNDNVVIIPFNRDQLNANSYDTTLGEYYYQRNEANIPEFFNPFSGKHVSRYWGVNADPKDHYGAKKARVINTEKEAKRYDLQIGDKYIIIKAGHIILGHTEQFIGGRENVTTMMKARSSMGRTGLTVCSCAGLGDVGYFNRYTYEIHNRNPTPVVLKVGERIGQILFMRTGEVLVSYEKRGQYQAHSGITQLITQWDPLDLIPRCAIDYLRLKGKIEDPPVGYTSDILTVLHKYVIPPESDETPLPKIEDVIVV